MEFLIGNGLGFVLKRFAPNFSNKAIPVALFVWNMFYHMLKTYDPTFQGMPVEGASMMTASMGDPVMVQVGFFSVIGGLFQTAAVETAKQMAAHAVGKNTFAQFLLPAINDKIGLVKTKRR